MTDGPLDATSAAVGNGADINNTNHLSFFESAVLKKRRGDEQKILIRIFLLLSGAKQNQEEPMVTSAVETRETSSLIGSDKVEGTAV